MEKNLMFCHQCQETAMNKGCSMKQGVCGKKAEVANLQDLLIWTLKGISIWAVKGKKYGIYDENAAYFVDKHLFTKITNTDFVKDNFIKYIKKAIEIRDSLKEQVLENEKINENNLPECAIWSPQSESDIIDKAESGTTGWLAIQNEDIRSLKSIVLYGLKGISAYLEHGYQIKGKGSGKDIFEFLFEALAELADDNSSQDQLLKLVMKTGEMGVVTMKYLDEANAHYGEQEITEVNLGVRNNPGILISFAIS